MPEVTSTAKKKHKPKIKSLGKQYSLDQSPLYNLSTKKKLEELLGAPIQNIETLCGDENYRVFQISKGGKPREVQAPCYELDVLHAKIASYLSRLRCPDYLHSGIKGRSHITNARRHLGDTPMLTMDIKKFYPSVSKKSVHHFFNHAMQMPTDVSAILANLCCYQDGLPTGSKLSMPLSFWCNHDMYEKLHRKSQSSGVTMTVYVDDLTFSGRGANKLFERIVAKIIREAGFEIHPTKTRTYKPNQSKLVTGVIINGHSMQVRNRHHQAIHEAFNALGSCKNEVEFEAARKSLIGKLNAAGQVDPVFKQRMKTYKTSTKKYNVV